MYAFYIRISSRAKVENILFIIGIMFGPMPTISGGGGARTHAPVTSRPKALAVPPLHQLGYPTKNCQHDRIRTCFLPDPPGCASRVTAKQQLTPAYAEINIILTYLYII